MSLRFVALRSCRCVRWESAAPAELKKCVETINPGLAPWAMQECRPIGGYLVTTPKSNISIVVLIFDTSVVVSRKYSLLDNIIFSIIFRIDEFVILVV